MHRVMHTSTLQEEVVMLWTFDDWRGDVVIRASDYDLRIPTAILERVIEESESTMVVEKFAKLVVAMGGSIKPHAHALPYFDRRDFEPPGKPTAANFGRSLLQSYIFN